MKTENKPVRRFYRTGRPVTVGHFLGLVILAVLPCVAPPAVMPRVALGAVERFVTTAGLVRGAPFVAHVRVIQSRQVSGLAAREYELEVLEVFKPVAGAGSSGLPPLIRVRILSELRAVNPGGKIQPAGSEWIVILGNPSTGVYPLRSLQWGRIDVATNPETGEQLLLRQLTGFPAPARGSYHSLSEFRQMLRDLLSLQLHSTEPPEMADEGRPS